MGAPAILLVDDDPAELELLGYTVEEALPGAQVRGERDSTLVRSICESDPFDCVMIDYNMPGLDGLACALALRGSFPYLPIILTTAVGDEMLAAHAVRSGVTDYIPKARVTPESLRRTVEHAIQLTGQARIIHEQRDELENFAYALAHDFKQPIRQIRTFSNLVAEALHEGRMTGVQQHLGFLSNAARRLADLVDVMSQYTLLNKPPQIGDVDLNHVLAGLRSSLAPYLEERGGQIIVSPGPTIRGNEALMTQVLQNLTVNGLKYNESKTPIVIITAETTNECCVIKIEDNGIGIEEEYFEEIFRPLARLHNSSEYAGSGLGLTLARKAVTAQGGTIWCQSEPGMGSEFFVRMPLAQAWAESVP